MTILCPECGGAKCFQNVEGLYPCKDCIVRGICSDMKNCDKTDDSKWRNNYTLYNKCCVDCGGTEAAENIKEESPDFIVCINCKSIYYRSTFGYLIKHNWKKGYVPKGFTATTFSDFINKHDFKKGK